jgi:hypothetical protein
MRDAKKDARTLMEAEVFLNDGPLEKKTVQIAKYYFNRAMDAERALELAINTYRCNDCRYPLDSYDCSRMRRQCEKRVKEIAQHFKEKAQEVWEDGGSDDEV